MSTRGTRLLLAAGLALCLPSGARPLHAPADVVSEARLEFSVERDTFAVRIDSEQAGTRRPAHLFFARFEGAMPADYQRLHGLSSVARVVWTDDTLIIASRAAGRTLLLTTRGLDDATRGAVQVASLVHHAGPGAAPTSRAASHTDAVYQQDPPPDPGGTNCPSSCGCYAGIGNTCSVACSAPRCASCLCWSELASCTCVLGR
jgi:hypothetical protein